MTIRKANPGDMDESEFPAPRKEFDADEPLFEKGDWVRSDCPLLPLYHNRRGRIKEVVGSMYVVEFRGVGTHAMPLSELRKIR